MTANDWRNWARHMLTKSEKCNDETGTTWFTPAEMWGVHEGTQSERALYAFLIAEFIETEVPCCETCGQEIP